MNDPEKRFKAIVKRLKETGQKLTPQRLAIVRVLAKSEAHPTVEMIFEQLRHAFPTMSLATVYRNVLMIKSLGEVLELGFPDGSNRYDGNNPMPHPHVVCVRCRKIIDPEIKSMEGLAQSVSGCTGFKITSHRMDFFGVCPDCQKNERLH